LKYVYSGSLLHVYIRRRRKFPFIYRCNSVELARGAVREKLSVEDFFFDLLTFLYRELRKKLQIVGHILLKLVWSGNAI
jgi:hypothetical protein